MALSTSQVILYAADVGDYQYAIGAAALAGIPISNVTGNFSNTWNDVASGNYLVIAVGTAALNALYYNQCGWTNPAGQAGGSTPFALTRTSPVDSLPGANVFENASGNTGADSLYLALAYAYYAVHGTLPSDFNSPPTLATPQAVCSGSPSVSCPCSGVQWGVDSATAVTQSFLNCINSNYGTPYFFGRYLQTVSGVSDGLSQQEINLIQGNGIKILVVDNSFGSNVSGYSNGQTAANNAISYAENTLKIPAGVAIYADIEEGYSVDAVWLEGWADTLASSPYKAGFYGNPQYGAFPGAFCTASAADSNVASAILWANNATVGVTTKSNAPSFNPPSNLSCSADLWVWQYGTGGTACQTSPGVDDIDTNLIKANATPYLF